MQVLALRYAASSGFGMFKTMLSDVILRVCMDS